MVRMIKRYGSRKLYDTEESRYVGLDEIAGWIREGQEIRVIDNASSEDVTSQTLVQIISEEGRRGTSALPTEFLHELIRRGEELFSSGIRELQGGVDRLVRASIDRIGPVRKIKDETARLRERLEQLESSLAEFEQKQVAAEPAGETIEEEQTDASR